MYFSKTANSLSECGHINKLRGKNFKFLSPIGSFHKKPTYLLNLDVLHFLEICTYICLELKLSSLRYIWSIVTNIRGVGCSKMTKFSQNKILKITCINNVLSVAHKTVIYGSFLKLIKSTFLQSIETLFVTDFFFILWQKLKQIKEFISKK
jgi:hypothetical protein